MTKTLDEIKKGIDWNEVDNSLQKVRFDDAGDCDVKKPKTPEEIKKGLECHARECGCDMGCPYVDVCDEFEVCPVSADALALIQQLQAENAEKDARIHQLEAERDAAVGDMTELVQNSGDSFCEYCKNWKPSTCPPYCRTHSEGFRWRGVQKEE